MTPPPPLHVQRLDRLPFDDAQTLQERLADERRTGAAGDTLLLFELEPVITLGKSADPSHVLASESVLASRGVVLRRTDRGGEATYHGPGQAVAYPIVGLRERRWGARRFVWTLEEAMIRSSGDFGVTAGRREGLVGIWIEDRKIGSIGVRISGGVTRHGLALNVNTHVDAFGLIVPCGLKGVTMTSLAIETGRTIPMSDAFDALEMHFRELFSS